MAKGARVQTIVPRPHIKDQRKRYVAVCDVCEDEWRGRRYLAYTRAATEMEKHNFLERRKHAAA